MEKSDQFHSAKYNMRS